MKTKLLIAALLCAININVKANSASGALDVSYTDEYYFRGANLGEDSVQYSASGNINVSGLDLFVNGFTNQTNGSGTSNTDILTVGVGKSFADNLLSVYGGVVNVDDDTAGSQLDAFVSVNFDTLLKPRVTLYRNTSDDLYTIEGCVSHKFDLNVVDLTLSACAGSTELTQDDSRTYVGATAKVSKTINQFEPHVCLSVINTDEIETDTIVKAGLTFKF